MGCSTTFLGIIIGFFIANLPGAFVGGLVGYILENTLQSGSRRRKTSYRNYQQQSAQREKLIKNLFSLLAKFCQADGQVTRAEIRIIDDFVNRNLSLSPAARKKAIKYFDEAKKGNKSFDYFAEKFASMTNYDSNLLYSVYRLLEQISRAEGAISSEQNRLLQKTEEIFRLSQKSYNGQKSYTYGGAGKYVNTPAGSKIREAYKTLDLTPEASKEKIKKRYREMAKKYHPDRAVAEDMPEEFVEMAKEKFTEIKEAYELIMETEYNSS